MQDRTTSDDIQPLKAAVRAECEKIRSGYWSQYLPSGVPVPGFLNELPEGDSLLSRLLEQLAAIGPQYRLLFALEVEHRRQPILTLTDLDSAVEKVRAPGYDFGDAEALSKAVLEAQWQVQRDSSRSAEEYAAARDGELGIANEIRAKGLPADRETNMQLIWATLKRSRS